MTLVQQGVLLYNQLKGQCTSFTFCGHSLGGTAALCLATRIPGTKSVSLNAGAAPTNPVLSGPGQSRSVDYHIVGDWISSHISDDACVVVRVKNKNSIGSLWGTNAAHSSINILAGAGPWAIVTAEEEDLLFQKFQNSKSKKLIATPTLQVAKYFGYIKKADISSPIPGSTRWQLLQAKTKILT